MQVSSKLILFTKRTHLFLKDHPLFIAYILCIVFFTVYSHEGLDRLYAHDARGDITSFAQGIWNTTEGRIMQGTFNYSLHEFWSPEDDNIPLNSNIFGVHFNPILLLFVPIYKLFPVPHTLIIIQALLTALGGIIIFTLSLKIIKNVYVSFAVLMSYLANYSAISAVLSEFHAYTLSIFTGIMVLFAYQKKKRILYYIFLILFLLVQENTALIAFFSGFSLMLNKDTRKQGLITSVISIMYFFFVTKIVIPALSNYGYYLFESVYGNTLGGNIKTIILTSVKEPIRFFNAVFNIKNAYYVFRIILPTLPFSLFAPQFLIPAIGSVIPNILSSSDSLKSLSMHYESASIPFLYIAYIIGIGNVLRLYGRGKKTIVVILILICFVNAFAYKKYTSHTINPRTLFISRYTSVDGEIDYLVKKIPKGESVSTQDHVSTQLTQRRELYLFPVFYKKVRYLLLSKGNDVWPLMQEDHLSLLEEIENDPSFRVAYQTENYVLYVNTSNTE